MNELSKREPKLEIAAKNEFERAALEIQEVNVWTERIIGQLMAYIHQDDTDFALIPFLCGVLEPNQNSSIGDKQLAAIEKAANGLKGANYTLYFGPHHWKAFPLFEYIEFKDGLIEGKFNKALRPFLLGKLAPQFAVRNLTEFKVLNSVHAQIMYKLCNSWKDYPDFEMSVEDLKVIFRCWKQRNYDEFKYFNSKVLQPAIRKINKVSKVMPIISCKVSKYDIPDRKRNPKAKRGNAIRVKFTFTPRKAQIIEEIKKPSTSQRILASEIKSVERDMEREKAKNQE